MLLICVKHPTNNFALFLIITLIYLLLRGPYLNVNFFSVFKMPFTKKALEK